MDNEKILISVIVPVYNKEKYIHKTINSLINQNSNEFEILLIDDGSTDSSGKICDDYEKNDTRIKVFHKIYKGKVFIEGMISKLTKYMGLNGTKI